MPSDVENAVALVKRGYNEDTRCLGFRVRFFKRELPSACEAIKSIGWYNDFDGAEVAAGVSALKDHLGSYPGVEVGRESSPVLYLTAATAADVSVIGDEMHALRADEVDLASPLVVRAWWD